MPLSRQRRRALAALHLSAGLRARAQLPASAASLLSPQQHGRSARLLTTQVCLLRCFCSSALSVNQPRLFTGFSETFIYPLQISWWQRHKSDLRKYLSLDEHLTKSPLLEEVCVLLKQGKLDQNKPGTCRLTSPSLHRSEKKLLLFSLLCLFPAFLCLFTLSLAYVVPFQQVTFNLLISNQLALSMTH